AGLGELGALDSSTEALLRRHRGRLALERAAGQAAPQAGAADPWAAAPGAEEERGLLARAAQEEDDAQAVREVAWGPAVEGQQPAPREPPADAASRPAEDAGREQEERDEDPDLWSLWNVGAPGPRSGGVGAEGAAESPGMGADAGSATPPSRLREYLARPARLGRRAVDVSPAARRPQRVKDHVHRIVDCPSFTGQDHQWQEAGQDAPTSGPKGYVQYLDPLPWIDPTSIRQALRSESAVSNSQVTCSVLWGLANFFKTICLTKLRDRCKLLGFPAQIAMVFLSMDRGTKGAAHAAGRPTCAELRLQQEQREAGDCGEVSAGKDVARHDQRAEADVISATGAQMGFCWAPRDFDDWYNPAVAAWLAEDGNGERQAATPDYKYQRKGGRGEDTDLVEAVMSLRTEAEGEVPPVGILRRAVAEAREGAGGSRSDGPAPPRASRPGRGERQPHGLQNPAGRILFVTERLPLLSGRRAGRQERPRAGANADLWQRVARVAGDVEAEA
ncbi:unnamed protein product, partial [Prorocentrum cordatum]